MPYIYTLFLLLMLPIQVFSAPITEAKEPLYHQDSLFKQEEGAQKKLNPLFLDNSYQHICLKQMTQLAKLYADTNILKGDISRIYFFCESQFDYKLTPRQRRGFEIWDMKDPVSIFECERERQRQNKKMASNTYIINRC